MKCVAFILISIFCFTNVSCQKINVITIKSIEKEISTPYRINCDNFEGSFSKILKERTIKSDTVVLKNLESLLKNITYTQEEPTVDVRTKVIVTYQNRKNLQIICVGDLDDILVDGKPIKRNKKLIELINKLRE